MRSKGKSRKDANYYYACFTQVDDWRFRLDTRIYLDEAQEQRSKDEGACVASVVCINPGSALEIELDRWTRLDRGKDLTLPTIRKRFVNAFRLAVKDPPEGAFVRVLNLFYLCDPVLEDAVETIRRIGSRKKVCSSEGDFHKIVWFAWGADEKYFAKLGEFKARFQDANAAHSFFFDNRRKEIRVGIPSKADFAKHPIRR